MSERKPRIAVDMDEVLADPLAKFIKLYNRDYNIPLDMKIAPGNEIRDHIPEPIKMKVREYINEKGFFRDLDVIPDAVEVMKELQKKYEVFIASAAMEFPNSLQDKYEWLADHFPFIGWEHIIFCGYKIVNVDILIDDRIKNFVGFEGRKLLFTSPHNMLLTDYERVDTWKEVAEKLL